MTTAGAAASATVAAAAAAAAGATAAAPTSEPAGAPHPAARPFGGMATLAVVVATAKTLGLNAVTRTARDLQAMVVGGDVRPSAALVGVALVLVARLHVGHAPQLRVYPHAGGGGGGARVFVGVRSMCQWRRLCAPPPSSRLLAPVCPASRPSHPVALLAPPPRSPPPLYSSLANSILSAPCDRIPWMLLMRLPTRPASGDGDAQLRQQRGGGEQRQQTSAHHTRQALVQKPQQRGNHECSQWQHAGQAARPCRRC